MRVTLVGAHLEENLGIGMNGAVAAPQQFGQSQLTVLSSDVSEQSV